MSANRLPGVYFETAAPPIPEALPRMDIPAFVGFAASGPLDVPVAIEDIARFREIFGQDQFLAWDTERGEMAYAQLPPAVGGFFRNGGRRCWVVRVADNKTAQSNEFMLPGLLQVGPDSRYEGSWAQARSEGSWSDGLMVNATLTFAPLDVSSTEHSENGYTLTLQPRVPSPVVAGDMLQLVLAGTQAVPPSPSDAILYLPLKNVTTHPVSGEPGLRPSQQAVLSAANGFWFRRAVQADFPLLQSSPPAPADSAGIVQLPQPRTAYWLTRPGNVALPVLGWGFSPAQNEFALETLRSQTDAIQAGTWLRLEFDPPFLPDGATAFLLLVGSVRGVAKESAPASLSSPAGNAETAFIVAAGAWWALEENKAVNSYNLAPEVTALGLELWWRDAQGKVSQFSDLGLAPLQPQYWGYLPSDVQLFKQSDRAETPPGVQLRDEVLRRHPRIPLAAPDGGAASAIYLPLGVPGFKKDEFYQPAVPRTQSALERDGLAPPGTMGCRFFNADFFLDPDLRNSGVSTLLTEAFHKQYQLLRPNESGPPGEPLQKMHSVIPIQEVSLLAVPDAVHQGWAPSGQQQQQNDLLAPRLLSISDPDAKDQIILSWSRVDGASSYTVQQSRDPQFGTANNVWEGWQEHSDPLAQNNACPVRSYFRVRANGASGISPWSNTLAAEFPPQVFELCKPDTLDVPVLAELGDNRGRITLGWSATATGIDSYRLEVAAEPTFEFPQLLYQGTHTSFEIWRSPTRTSYFRVSAQRGTAQSPFSNTVVAPAESGDPQWQMVRASDGAGRGPCEDELLAIHLAMLRMCAARGDMFAVLGLPRDYHTQPALDYKDRLVSALAPEETEHTLSFGALYHPWLAVRDGADDSPLAVRSLVPDGTVCGSIADRTINSGAWSAPANRVLLGVVDLEPRLAEAAAQEFFDGQVNLIDQESRGFMCASSYTLSTDTEVREINVRRLLILLRRLALRDGMEFVFQPNDTSLRYTVRRRFEEILSNLFRLGAFAGDTQDQGFRVVTDSFVNPPEMVDQGRFVVELRVAPSSPLEFLTVRLVQTGGEILLTEQF